MSSSDPKPPRFQSFPGKVPIPPVETLSEEDSDQTFLPWVVIALALLLLLLLLLLVFSASRPQTSSGGDHDTGGAGTGTGVGIGSGDSDGAGGETTGGRGDADLDEPSLEGRTGSEGELEAEDVIPDASPGNEISEQKSEHSDVNPLKSEPVPEEPSLGERIADNLSKAPLSDEGGNQDGGGGGSGTVTVKVFGIGASGSSFVYVFDRSSSMSGQKLREAKRELLESLAVLNNKHRFNIIFYDDSPTVWKPGGKLVVANASTKKDAEAFVTGMPTRGGTAHLRPLLEAIEFKPDIIFFLTDGQSLTKAELEKISEKSGEISINVIQFAEAGESKSEILRQLAARNRGRYKYINVFSSDAL